jgi:hypothetical protein
VFSIRCEPISLGIHGEASELMHDRLLLVERTIELLFLFVALGSGPATGLIRDRRLRLATMPLLGFAIAACLLTTIAHFLTLATATWAILVPAAVISLVIAVVFARRLSAIGRKREVAVPAVMLLVSVTLALLPPISRGTDGPFALAVWDAWSYSQTSLYLQHHTIGTPLPAKMAHYDLDTLDGSIVNSPARIGTDAINASAATLFRTSTPESLTPLLAVLFGLLPVGIWLVVRGFGGSWKAAAVGSAFGVTPAILTAVEDTSLASLGGVVLVAPALFFFVRSRRHFIADAVVAGALGGGLVSVFSEFLPPFFIVVVCIGVVFGIAAVLRGAFRKWVGLAFLRIGVATITVFAIAPFSVHRALIYLSNLSGGVPWSADLPPRWLTVENVGSWSFGIRNLYELPTPISSGAALGFFVYFPAVLALIVLIGIVRLRIMGVFVAVPILAASALGIYTYRHNQFGHCQYCLWKALTFTIPFLAMGLALGIERLWRGRGKGRMIVYQRFLVTSITIVTLVAIGKADNGLIQLTKSSGAFCPCGFGSLHQRLDRIPSRLPILIEGTDSVTHPTFTLNAAYFAARGQKRTILWDAGYPALAYLITSVPDAPLYYAPDYEYVLTPFEDVRSGRRLLGHYGALALMRRAPIDVVVSRVSPTGPGWTVGNTKIPQGSGPFTLRVSSKRARDAAITLTLKRLGINESSLTFASEQRQLETIATSRNKVCIDVHLNRGATIIGATPSPYYPSAAPLPNELAITGIKAVPGRCGRGHSVEPFTFQDGWFPTEEPQDQANFNWMGSIGAIEVGTPGTRRPRATIRAQVMSFLRWRWVDAWLGGKRIASFQVSPKRQTDIKIIIPPGEGTARLFFSTRPGAESASILTPGDTRLISVRFSRVSIRASRTTS